MKFKHPPEASKKERAKNERIVYRAIEVYGSWEDAQKACGENAYEFYKCVKKDI